MGKERVVAVRESWNDSPAVCWGSTYSFAINKQTVLEKKRTGNHDGLQTKTSLKFNFMWLRVFLGSVSELTLEVRHTLLM